MVTAAFRSIYTQSSFHWQRTNMVWNGLWYFWYAVELGYESCLFLSPAVCLFSGLIHIDCTFSCIWLFSHTWIENLDSQAQVAGVEADP